MAMKADYEAAADLLAITLEDVDRLDGGEDTHGAIVHKLDGRPVEIDVVNPRRDLAERLNSVAKVHKLDGEALIAAAEAALAAPDRQIAIDVAARRAA